MSLIHLCSVLEISSERFSVPINAQCVQVQRISVALPNSLPLLCEVVKESLSGMFGKYQVPKCTEKILRLQVSKKTVCRRISEIVDSGCPI